MLRVVLDMPHLARVYCSGRLIARLTGIDTPSHGAVVYLSLYDPESGYTTGVGRWMRPDGSCLGCDEWHGWLLDAAIEAGWTCAALEAALTARSGADL
jgi:hypothetical protein